MRRELVLTFGVLLAGCPGPMTTPDAGLPTQPEPDGGLARSQKANLRFKGPERLTFDLSRQLELPPEQLCNELGKYPCTTFVHSMSLGGVDPYGVGMYEPAAATGTSSPLVVERIALSACAKRVALDLASPGSAVFFKGVTLDGQGRVDAASAPVGQAITSMYQHVLQRDPAAREVTALRTLATDIAATNTPRSGEAWMKASCFVVVSSAESVFY